MTINPTLTISIDRSSLPGSLSPLTFSAKRSGGTTRGIVAYQAPLAVPRNAFAPPNRFIDGNELLSSSWEQTSLAFDWVPVGATTEATVQAAYIEVLAAIGQFAFEVTTKVSDADGQVWSAYRGAMSPNPRTLLDLSHLCPVYPVVIPVQPIPGAPTP